MKHLISILLLFTAILFTFTACEETDNSANQLSEDSEGGPDNGDGGGIDSPPANDTAPASLSDLDDEFDDPSTLSQWTLRSTFESESSDGTVLITGGQMVLLPLADRYFLNSNKGLSMFKRIDPTAYPNFIVEARVYAYERGTSNVPPADYHAAGLAIYPDLADMSNWTVVNIGRQSGSAGFEGKNTNSNSSSLMLYGTGGVSEGRVRLCVIGGNITVYTRLNTDGAWTERRNFNHTIGGEIGVGLMINDYQTSSADMEGQFDYIRFQEIAGAGDCENDI